MTFKQEVYRYCTDLVESKIRLLQNTLKDLRESAANETKSTAGDKHETALAMLQIEQANTGAQLQEALNQNQQLFKINPQISAKQVVNGSFIKTNKGYFFISIALGKIIMKDGLVIALSPQSPLGSKFCGLFVNETTEMNGVVYKIETIE